MSRFGEYDYDPQYANQGELWWANAERALRGPKAQAALLDLYHALHALPERKLVSGHLVYGGQACAVGALVAYRKAQQAGTTVEAMLAQLEPDKNCKHCWHGEAAHVGGTCVVCREALARPRKARQRRPSEAARLGPGLDVMGYRRACRSFVPLPAEEDHDETEYETAEAGRAVGTTYMLAWRLAHLNDIELEGVTPEARWQNIMLWVVAHLAPVPV